MGDVLSFGSKNHIQMEEFHKLSRILENFTSRFTEIISQNDQKPENQWELLSYYSIDELLRSLGKISLYDFQAIEYLTILYFS